MDPADEPPARLRAFDVRDWLSLIDASEYDRNDYRDIRNHQPVGPVKMSFEDWRTAQAWRLFTTGRLDWCEEHGWLNGMDVVQVLQETVQMRRRNVTNYHPERNR